MSKPILEWSDDEVIAHSDELALRVMRKETTAADVRMVHELACRLRSANKRLVAAGSDKGKACKPCNETGAVHCADPANCGGPWDDRAITG